MQSVFEFYETLPRRPKRPERLFYMLTPDAQAAARARLLAETLLAELGLAGEPLAAERLHVSLHHVGDWPRLRSKLLYAARLAGAGVCMRPFEVVFRFVRSLDDARSLRGQRYRRALVLLGDGEGLHELHGRLGAGMRQAGLRAGHRFLPHMTLHYCSRTVPLQAIEPIRFVADGFALVHSELWLTRYNMLGRWAFAPAPQERGADG